MLRVVRPGGLHDGPAEEVFADDDGGKTVALERGMVAAAVGGVVAGRGLVR